MELSGPLSLGEMQAGLELVEWLDVPRPRTRRDCVDGPRPCPWIGCHHHVFCQSMTENLLRVMDADPCDLPFSCALDVAEQGGVPTDVVALILGLSKETVRKAEVDALSKLRKGVEERVRRELEQLSDEDLAGKMHDPSELIRMYVGIMQAARKADRERQENERRLDASRKVCAAIEAVKDRIFKDTGFRPVEFNVSEVSAQMLAAERTVDEQQIAERYDLTFDRLQKLKRKHPLRPVSGGRGRIMGGNRYNAQEVEDWWYSLPATVRKHKGGGES